MQSSYRVSELIQTQGIKANRHRELSVSFEGGRWYDVLELLEKQAERGGPFVDLARFVTVALDIRAQLKRQGF